MLGRMIAFIPSVLLVGDIAALLAGGVTALLAGIVLTAWPAV